MSVILKYKIHKKFTFLVRFFSVIVILILANSCDYFTIKKDDRVPIARVNNNFLYKEDIAAKIDANLSGKDSVIFVQSIINDWVKQQLLLQKAKLNLQDEEQNFERLVQKYREDLFINSYKEAVVKQYLDTVITESDIDEYYLSNNQNFKLNEELLKFRYIKIGKSIFEKKELTKLFKSLKKSDLDSLQSKELFLNSHHLNDSIWIKFTDVLSTIPILKTIDKAELLKKDNFIQKEDSLSLYLVIVKDVLKRNEIAPKSYILPTIRQMILHQRKLLLLKEIEETLFNDAKKENEFEIY